MALITAVAERAVSLLCPGLFSFEDEHEVRHKGHKGERQRYAPWQHMVYSLTHVRVAPSVRVSQRRAPLTAPRVSLGGEV